MMVASLESDKSVIALNFFGPFKFIAGASYLYDSEFVKSEGIYIWTIKDESGRNLVHYVGETISFGKRHREHLIQITGLNYRIIDPEAAKRGQEEILWNGLWRDRTSNGVASLLERYDEISSKVKEYVSLINVYFAPTSFETDIRKHIEGCLGWNLRNNHPEAKVFYPDDNHVGTKSQRFGKTLIVNLPEPIVGIDKEQSA